MKQEERLIDYLSTNESITSIQALNELGILTSRMVPVTNRYGEKCHVSEYSMRARNDS
jgi:hypothetical protein